jgi:2-dehydropantoate 2-reductase
MKFAILGAGATGGIIGARLALSEQPVILIARGAHLAAIRERGLTVRDHGKEVTVRVDSTDDVAAAGDADAVLVTLKAHQIGAVAETLGRALKEGAFVVSAQNGIPWWYFPDRHLESVDPGGRIAAALPAERVVGGVVYLGAQVVEPGVVEHGEGSRLTVGEPDGSRSERVEQLSAALTRAGFKAPVSTRIRNEVWLKLLGNATFNPVSVLTRATLAQMAGTPAGRELIGDLMGEVQAVATALGVELPRSVEQRLDGAAGGGEHKTSMLQDLEAGRPLEIDALLGAVVELADGGGVAVPGLRTLLRLVRLLEATRA